MQPMRATWKRRTPPTEEEPEGHTEEDEVYILEMFLKTTELGDQSPNFLMIVRSTGLMHVSNGAGLWLDVPAVEASIKVAGGLIWETPLAIKQAEEVLQEAQEPDGKE